MTKCKSIHQIDNRAETARLDRRRSRSRVVALSWAGGEFIKMGENLAWRAEQVKKTHAVTSRFRAALLATGAEGRDSRLLRRVAITRGEGFPVRYFDPKRNAWRASGELAGPSGRLP